MLKKYLFFMLITLLLCLGCDGGGSSSGSSGSGDNTSLVSDNVTVIFDAVGGRFDDGKTIYEKVITKNGTFDISTIKQPSKVNAEFTGWQDAAGTITTGTVTATDNLTYYARWKVAETITVTLNANSGLFDNGFIKKITLVKGKNFNIDSNPKPEKEYFSFTGWCAVQDCSVPATLTSITADVVFYAKWEPNPINLTLKGNGGQFNGNSEKAVTVNQGILVADIEKPARVGFGFNGWFADSSCSMPAPKIISQDATYYACWVADQYHVWFNSNGGSAIATINNYNIAIPLDTTSPLYKPDKDGAFFVGWFTDEALIIPAGNALIISTDTTLYAKWDEVAFDNTTFEMSDIYINVGTRKSEKIKINTPLSTVSSSSSIVSVDYNGLDVLTLTPKNTMSLATITPHKVTIELTKGSETIQKIVEIWVKEDGTTSYPYLIDSEARLNLIKYNTNKSFKLLNDIALENEWEPVAFTGNFYGDNHTISGLYINKPTVENVGFFSTTGIASDVRDVRIVTSITGVNGGKNVGILVGRSNCTPVNVHTSGKVQADSYGGGIVGYITGSLFRSSSSADVVVTNDYAGGITARGGCGDCYSTGNVKGRDYVGGIAGTPLEVFRSYATGKIEGNNRVGGIGGYINNGNSINKSLALNFSITGATNAGRVYGSAFGSGTNNFGYDTVRVNNIQVSGTLSSIHGESVLSGDLDENFYKNKLGFNFTDIWVWRANDKPPVLKGQ